MRHLSIASPGMIAAAPGMPEVIAESIEDASTRHKSGNAERVVGRPPAAKAGDLAIAFTVGRPGGTTVTVAPPADWTRWHYANPNTNTAQALDAKVLTDAEPASWTWVTNTSTNMLGVHVVILRHASADLGEHGTDFMAAHLEAATDWEWYGPDWVTLQHPALVLNHVHALYNGVGPTELEPPITAPEHVTPLAGVFTPAGRLFRSLAGHAIAPAGAYDPSLWGMPTNLATVRSALTVSVYPA